MSQIKQMLAHQIGNRKPAQAIGNLDRLWFPDGVVMSPHSLDDIPPIEIS